MGDVDIGYLEETSSWKLESRFFPSKVGGKPAWLNLADLPIAEALKCTKCLNQCIFLCQVYAPIEDSSLCFHRTVFIFLCPNPDCWNDNFGGNFHTLRCQLPRENQFYPFEPPIEDKNWKSDLKADKYSSLCIVCGSSGTSRCGKCKIVYYCSKEHQVKDWKASHKQDCGTVNERKPSTVLLPEFELLTEPENLASESEKNDNDHEKLLEYEKLAQTDGLGTFQGESSVDDDLLKMAVGEDDKQFRKFDKRVKLNPDQVLRYDRGGDPLWVSANGLPEAIPPCPFCGGRRQFEFQVMPQLLNYLALDSSSSIDWGVLAVFTCEKSCNEGPVYKAEFLWKQDFDSGKGAASVKAAHEPELDE